MRNKAKKSKLSSNKKLIIATASILTLTSIGVGLYLANTKTPTPTPKRKTNKPKAQTNDVDDTDITTEITTTSTSTSHSSGGGNPSIITVSVIDTEESNDMPNTTNNSNVTPHTPTNTNTTSRGMGKLEQATQLALSRAFEEYNRNVRDLTSENTILDQQGNLYDCSYNKIGTFTSALPIFTYIKEGLGINKQYYSNATSGPCASKRYSWCGAFVAYCWIKVDPYYRSEFFPGVTRLKQWANQDPRRYVDSSDIQPGDILLISRPDENVGSHIAMCYEVLGNGVFKTIEGNTYGDGQPEGVCYRTRYTKNSPAYTSSKSYIIQAIRPLESDIV
jgi:hypothetical protein